MQTVARQHRSSSHVGRIVLAWQGLSMRVPADWNAVKIEGDARAGLVLLADLESAKLGIRWARAPKSGRSDDAIVRAAMQEEVGELATKQAANLRVSAADGYGSQLLYEDPEPPGSDVWIGLSDDSRRLVQISYRCKRRDRVLADEIMPAFSEQAGDSPQRWSVLDLSCIVPSEFSFKSQQLSAGDLRLSFVARNRRQLNVRQVGPATLALARQPLEKWLAADVAPYRRLYRVSDPSPLTIDGRLHGLCVTLARRRRAFLHRSLPMAVFSCAVCDEGRNRLVMIQASERATAEDVAASVGWASREMEPA